MSVLITYKPSYLNVSCMAAGTDGPVNGLLKRFEFTKDNLINFSDAVFAIAITLLAIDLKVPEGLAGDGGYYLLSALFNLWPYVLSYVISFGLIAVYWYNYHKIIHYVAEVDDHIISLNIGFLFFVTIMPFAASVLGRYGNESIAVVLYAAWLALGSTVLFLLWRHIRRKYLLVEKALNKKYFDYLSIRTLFSILVALLTVILALFSPFVAEIFLLLDPISTWLGPSFFYWLRSRLGLA